MAQKLPDQTVIKFFERLKSQGYEVNPNAALRGKSGSEHTFDYLLMRRDGFMNLAVAAEIITEGEDPEVSLHKLFAFQDKCSDCDIKRSVVIAIPRLSFVASQFAQKDGVEVFDDSAIQMFLARPPASRPLPKDLPTTFTQKAEVTQALKQLGYRVDESVKVVGSSGSAHVFGSMALWDDGFILSRLGIDYVSGDTVDKGQVSLFDDKCRDAGITDRMLLVSGALADDAKSLAEQRKIQIVNLEERKRGIASGAGTVSLQTGVKEAAKEERVKDRGVDGEPKEVPAAGVMSLPIPGAKEAVGQKVETPAGADGGGKLVVPVGEAPSRARPFSMRSVIDQFLSPQIRAKEVEKKATPVDSKPDAPEKVVVTAKGEVMKPGAVVGKPTVAQVTVTESSVVEVRPAEPKAASAVDKPTIADGKGPGVKAIVAKATEAKAVPVAEKPVSAQAKAEETKVAEVKLPEPRPAPPADKLGTAQVKPVEAKAVLVAEKPGLAQAKAPEGKATETRPTAGKVTPIVAGGPKAPLPGVEKTSQAKVLPSEMKVDVAAKPPSEEQVEKPGVIGKSRAGATVAFQPPKVAMGKQPVEKRPAPMAQTKVAAKPTEPPKPVVEQVVEKPKVKLRKAARPEALQLIPEASARRFTVLPISVDDNVLEVAMVNPGELTTIQVLEHQSKMRIKAVAAEKQEILDAIDFNYKGFGQIAEQISHIDTIADVNAGVDLVAATANAPVAAALNLIIEEAVKARASDIHIEPEEKRLRIRYRIDGVLHEVMSLPIKIHPPLTSRVKVMSDLNIADHLRPQDGQFSVDVKGKGVDVRVATSPTVHGETVVMRLLDKSTAVMDLPQLGFSADSLEKFEKALAVPFGMICVSGPTGAGKTTTLYAALNTLDKTTRNIITVEDPVEYRFAGMKQIQVNPKAGLTFANVLRSMMRLDPDVILVGEIRDAETASIAVKSALTGHLVLCSIHANDAVGVVYRLLDLGVEPFMVASVITGTLAQRMARRICSNCATEVKPTPVEAAAYESATGEKLEKFLSGSGCDLCSFSGYKGRLGLFEILTMTDASRAMILRGATTSELRTQAVKEGMITLFKDGMLKVKAGMTTVSEVLRNAYSID